LDAVPGAAITTVAAVLRRTLGRPLLAEGYTTPEGALARVPLPSVLPPSAVVLCRGGAGGGAGYTCQRVAEWEAAGGGDECDLAVLWVAERGGGGGAQVCMALGGAATPHTELLAYVCGVHAINVASSRKLTAGMPHAALADACAAVAPHAGALLAGLRGAGWDVGSFAVGEGGAGNVARVLVGAGEVVAPRKRASSTSRSPARRRREGGGG
jgi:hypothetical protein